MQGLVLGGTSFTIRGSTASTADSCEEGQSLERRATPAEESDTKEKVQEEES